MQTVLSILGKECNPVGTGQYNDALLETAGTTLRPHRDVATTCHPGHLPPDRPRRLVVRHSRRSRL